MEEKRSYNFIYSLAISLVVVSTISFLLLTPLGHWQPDEYAAGYLYRTEGLHGLIGRLTSWDPRPLSELMSYLYHDLVEMTGKRHVGAFLFTYWVVMMAGALLPVIFLKRSDRKIPILIVSSLILLCIAGLNNSDVFYWVESALPYVPTLAAVLFVTSVCLLTEASILKREWLALVGLVIGALFSEVGAMFAWIISLLMIAYWGACKLRKVDVRASTAGIFFPAWIISSAVFVFFITARLNYNEAKPGSETADNIAGSIIATLRRIPTDTLFYGENVVTGNYIYVGILSKSALFTLSFLYFTTRVPIDGERILSAVLCIAAAGTAFFLLFMTYYHFGGDCCSRHTTMEQALLWVAIVAAAKFLATFFAFRGARDRISYRAMCVAGLLSVLPSIVLTVRPLVINYSRFHEIRSKNEYVWEHRFDAGPAIVIKRYPPGEITGGGEQYFPEMVFEKGVTKHPVSWAADYVLKYYGKDKLIVEGN